MGSWIDQHLTTPVVTALISGAIVPLVVVWYRHRRTFSEIGEGLSKSEAAFRADLIVQINNLRADFSELHTKYLECERQHAEARIKISELEAILRNR